MEQNRLPEGLWPVMLTPFDSNGGIDYPALEQLTGFYLEQGAAGLFANCLSSEMYQLTARERIDLVRAILQTTGGNVPVIATGTFGFDIGGHVRTIREMYDLGVAAVVLVTSQVAGEKESDDQLKRNLDQILENTGTIPLGLYECPVPYKRLLSVSLAGYLAHTGRFLYYKETSCNTREIREKLSAIKKTKLRLYNANTPTALASLHHGAMGLSPISANFYPELYALLCRMGITKPETAEACLLQQYLSVMDAVTRIKYPLNAKLFLNWRGLKINPRTRIEVPPLHYEEIRMLESLFDLVKKIKDEFHPFVADVK
jgi:4-hydroxy-tetrahydrodipicolinate synthase